MMAATIGQKIEELREAFKKEYGLDVKVNISAYDNRNDIKPKEAASILKGLKKDHEVTGDTRTSSDGKTSSGKKFGWSEIDGDSSSVAIFYSLEGIEKDLSEQMGGETCDT